MDEPSPFHLWCAMSDTTSRVFSLPSASFSLLVESEGSQLKVIHRTHTPRHFRREKMIIVASVQFNSFWVVC